MYSGTSEIKLIDSTKNLPQTKNTIKLNNKIKKCFQYFLKKVRIFFIINLNTLIIYP